MRQIHLFIVTSAAMLVAVPASAEERELIRIRLKAADDGSLAELIVDGKTITASKDGKRSRMEVLQSLIRRRVGMKKMECEVELDGDYDLKYSHVIEVIRAISGYTEGDRVVPLIDKIKFAPPCGGPETE